MNGDNRKQLLIQACLARWRAMTEYSERYVLAIDQGTTSTRCIIFDRHGRLVGVRQREHEQHFPRPGMGRARRGGDLEQRDPDRPGGAARGRHRADKVAALGVANQRETTVLWDRHTGVPIGRAIVWQDARTAAAPGPDGRAPGRRPGRGAVRAAAVSLLLRAAAALALRPRRRPARTRGARRRAVRHDGDLADLEPDRRPGRRACTSPT